MTNCFNCKQILCAILSCAAFLWSVPGGAQDTERKGQVVDASTGEPLVGAGVLIQGSLTGSMTDLDGYFIINAGDDAVLVISTMGYKEVQVPVNGRSDLGRIAVSEDTELLDEVIVPAGVLKTNYSYARVNDGLNEWEVKDDSAEKYVTPSTNNKTIESNPKMDKFEQHDPVGVGMSVSAMAVVFIGLILLYICFRFIGKIAVSLRKRNAMKVQNVTDHKEAKEMKLGEAPGEVIAAISMALHEAQGADHDIEETILTISRVKRSYSPWSSKIYTLRETPNKK